MLRGWGRAVSPGTNRASIADPTGESRNQLRSADHSSSVSGLLGWASDRQPNPTGAIFLVPRNVRNAYLAACLFPAPVSARGKDQQTSPARPSGAHEIFFQQA